MNNSLTKEKNRLFIKTVLILLIPSVILLVVGILLLPSGELARHYTEVDGQEAKIIVEELEADIVDLRKEEEFNEGHIPGSFNVQAAIIKKNYNTLDRSKMVLIISNQRDEGRKVADFLIDKHFTEVFLLNEGVSEWPGDLVSE